MLSENSPKAPGPPMHASSSRWMAGGASLMFASMVGQTSLIAQFNGALRHEFDLSNGQFSALYSGATLASACIIFFAGNLTDRFAARPLAAIALVLLALTAFCAWVIQNPVHLALFLTGVRFLGQGMLIHVAMTSMGRWFQKRRGRAISVASVGLTVGEAVLPFSVALAIASFGWRAVWVVIAVALATIMLPLILYLFKDAPEQRPGQTAPQSEAPWSADDHQSGGGWTRKRVLRDPLFWTLFPGLMTMPCVGSLIIFHQGHLAGLKGWSQLQFTAFLPVIAVTSALASLFGGALVDRFGAWRMISIYLLPLMLACVGLAFVKDLIWLPAILALFGVTLGLSGLLISSLWLELHGTAHAGSIRAISTSGVIIASAVGPGAAGVLIDLGVSLDEQALIFAAWCIGWSAFYTTIEGKLLSRIENLS